MSEYSDFVSQYMQKARPKSLAEGRQAMKAAAAEWRRKHNPLIVEEICPECGAALLVPTGVGRFSCPKCGSILRQV